MMTGASNNTGADISHCLTPGASACFPWSDYRSDFHVYNLFTNKLKSRLDKSFENLFVSPCNRIVCLCVSYSVPPAYYKSAILYTGKISPPFYFRPLTWGRILNWANWIIYKGICIKIISPQTKIRDNHWIRPVTWWPYMRLCTVSKLNVRQPVPKIVRREKQDGGQRSCCYGIFWRSICAETV